LTRPTGVTRRRPPRAHWIGRAILATAVAIAIAVFLILPRLPFSPFGIRAPTMLIPRITVCDRNYHGGAVVRSRAEIEADGAPIVLVDPGPFGFFPSCPQPDENGNRPCTRDAADGPCATVVYVRVGNDSYAAYELVGGP
jgi:hypothetical protein